MRKISNRLCLSIAAALFAGQGLCDESQTSFSEAMSEAEYHLNLRYRFEFVDQDGRDEAKASTLKTRLNFKSKPYYGASAFVEMDSTSVVGSDDYNSTLNGLSQYAVVADPEYTEINQVYLNYAAPAETNLRFGRQRILLDNQRYVGGVGWRQNEQTYDGFSISNTALPDTTLFYGYIYNVNNIFGADADDVEHHLLNASTSALKVGKLSAYAYLLDNISDTYGLRFAGSQPMDEVKLIYTAEFATQSDNGTAAAYDANYYLAEIGAEVKGVTGLLGYEVQESDNGNAAFRTPLGTNHKFGGWADKFLATPATGLEDLYVSASTTVSGVKLAATYHVFTANEGGADYGDEIDLVAVKKFMKHYAVMLKYANYNADELATDTQKVWLQLAANF